MTESALVFVDMFGRFGIVAGAPIPLDAGIEVFVDFLAGAQLRLVVVLVHIGRRVLPRDTPTAAVIANRIEHVHIPAIRSEPRMTHRIIVRRGYVAFTDGIRTDGGKPEGNVRPHERPNELPFAQVKFTHTRQQGRGAHAQVPLFLGILAHAFINRNHHLRKGGRHGKKEHYKELHQNPQLACTFTPKPSTKDTPLSKCK